MYHKKKGARYSVSEESNEVPKVIDQLGSLVESDKVREASGRWQRG